MDEQYGGFCAAWRGGEGVSFAAAGICAPGSGEDCRRAFAELPDAARRALAGVLDPRAVDEALYRAVSGLTGGLAGRLYALGVTARVPGLPFVCGGIIGAPGTEPQSAEGLADALGHGLFCRAWPGGPGLAAACGKEEAEEIFAAAEAVLRPPGGSGGDVWERVRGLCVGLRAWLFVSDGSGPGAQGRVSCFAGGMAETAAL